MNYEHPLKLGVPISAGFPNMSISTTCCLYIMITSQLRYFSPVSSYRAQLLAPPPSWSSSSLRRSQSSSSPILLVFILTTPHLLTSVGDTWCRLTSNASLCQALSCMKPVVSLVSVPRTAQCMKTAWMLGLETRCRQAARSASITRDTSRLVRQHTDCHFPPCCTYTG